MTGGCDICAMDGCNHIEPRFDPYPKEKPVVNGIVAPHDVIVETSPGAGVKVVAEGTLISEDTAAEHGIRAKAPAENREKPHAENRGKRSSKG